MKTDTDRDAEAAFQRELQTFRQEVDQGLLAFYCWSSVHTMAAKSRTILNALNQTPTVWNTVMASLQQSTFMVLGRIFDRDARSHSVHGLLARCQDCLPLFGRRALAARKMAESANAHEWIDDFMRDAYEPTLADFARLARHVAKREEYYKSHIRPLRHKVYAHRDRGRDVSSMFSRVRIRDMQSLLVFLSRLYQCLFDLYYNGHKPVLPPVRHSVRRMLTSPGAFKTFPAMVSRETQLLLNRLAYATREDPGTGQETAAHRR